jgi:hypothetical protein
MNETKGGLYQSRPGLLYQSRPDEDDSEDGEGVAEHEVVESSQRSQNDFSRGHTLTSRVTSTSTQRQHQEEMAEQRKRFLCIAFGVIVLWCIIAAIIGGIIGSMLLA